MKTTTDPMKANEQSSNLLSSLPSMTSLSIRRKLLLVASFVIFARVASNFLSMFIESPSFFRRHRPASHSNPDVGYENTTKTNPKKSVVYVPGAGFSGFFYSLGRLQSLQRHEVSQRCLALVASLMEIPLGMAVDLAHTSRNRWMNSEIGRYSVVEDFVERLLADEHKSAENGICNLIQDNATTHHRIQQHLPRINIITSSWNKNSFVSQSVRRSFGKRDDQSLHNDGAFAGLLRGLTLTLADENHHSLRLPWNFDLLWNGLNMLLGHDRALQFWNEGLKRGID
eukprot:scaffold387_cov195-Alexandrium_tamarense.AAC.21